MSAVNDIRILIECANALNQFTDKYEKVNWNNIPEEYPARNEMKGYMDIVSVAADKMRNAAARVLREISNGK